MTDQYDRVVHAATPDGRRVVRYEKAGKWYIEAPSGRRAPVTVDEAVAFAMTPPAVAYLGRAGGTVFDARCRRWTKHHTNH